MGHSRPLVLTDASLNTPFAEAYRALRANINFSGLGQTIKSLLVTAGRPGEGKSTTVANLGILLARAGQRVVLLDADFRRHSLGDMVATNGNGHRQGGGLTDLIAGRATFADVAQVERPTGPVADLSDVAKVWFLRARERSGKTLLARWLAETILDRGVR